MNLIIRLVISTLSVYVASKILSGVAIDSLTTALVVAIVLGLLNTFIKPVLQLLALPITIITLGLFYFVINVLMIYLTDYLVAGFEISGFITALLFSLIISLISWFLGLFLD